MANKKELVGKFVQFIGCPNRLYKVLDEKNQSILVEDEFDTTYWERKEYIEYVIFEIIKRYVEYGY